MNPVVTDRPARGTVTFFVCHHESRTRSVRGFTWIGIALTVGLVACLGEAAWSGVGSDTTPNIIFIVTDDQGIDSTSIPYFPNQLDCHTPRLATLAAQGRVFTNCRVNPKCSPTRAGLMTGRSSFQHGVVGVVNPLWGTGESLELRDRVSLQTHEITIAEVLRSAGYQTILSGKWHVGWAERPRPTWAQWFHGEQMSLDQGFDTYVDYREFICGDRECGQYPPVCDCPYEDEDDLITWSVDQTLETLSTREPDTPYALFFWTIDPHVRLNPTTWWPVSESLLDDPDIYDMNDEIDRYRAVIEAMDRELMRLLFELGVVDENANVLPDSNTMVFYVSDNGTPQQVSYFDESRAKGSLYEGGIRVPMFVAGTGVPTDGLEVTRLVSHQDFFATIADVAGAKITEDPVHPRDSVSFASSIGRSGGSDTERKYTVSNLASHSNPLQEIALCDDTYKLIAPAGLPDFARIGGPESGGLDRFYRLDDEYHDLVAISNEEYLRFRERVGDFWPTAIGTALPNQVDVFSAEVASIDTEDVVDMTSDDLRIGHILSVAEVDQYESRLLIRFDSNAILEALSGVGKTLNDVVKAELIVRFGYDSSLSPGKSNEDPHFLQYDADTAPIRIHPLTAPWSEHTRWNDIRSDYTAQIDLGFVDLAPHIMLNDENDSLSSVPMVRGTPLTFGGNAHWTTLIRSWVNQPQSNHGVMLKAHAIPELQPGEQTVWFRVEEEGDVRLRITFKGARDRDHDLKSSNRGGGTR